MIGSTARNTRNAATPIALVSRFLMSAHLGFPIDAQRLNRCTRLCALTVCLAEAFSLSQTKCGVAPLNTIRAFVAPRARR
jgi:hypothetical protein